MQIRKQLGFTEILVDTAIEFIDLIRPEAQNLKQYLDCPNYNLIFRGQAESNWTLTPSLFRNISKNFLTTSYEGLCFKNWLQLKDFVKGCDLNAAIIPFDSYQFRNEFMKEFKGDVAFDSKCWPDPKLYELIAFAQHYGLPTELLDWSWNPLVASYFAASQVVTNKFLNGNMSIWVFDTEKQNLLNKFNQKNFEIIEVPKGFNQNISSQQGCFTLLRQSLVRGTTLTYEETPKRIRELKLLNELLDEKGVNALLKISVPQIIAPEILNFCFAYAINAATIFRGIEGAAIYAQEVNSIQSYKDLL